MNLNTYIFSLVIGLGVAADLSANPARLDGGREEAKSEADQARRERARQKKVGVQAIADATTEPRSPQWHIKMAADYSARALGYVAEGRDNVAQALARQALKQLDQAENKFPTDAPEQAAIAQMRDTIYTDILDLSKAEPKAMPPTPKGNSSAVVTESSE